MSRRLITAASTQDELAEIEAVALRGASTVMSELVYDEGSGTVSFPLNFVPRLGEPRMWLVFAGVVQCHIDDEARIDVYSLEQFDYFPDEKEWLVVGEPMLSLTLGVTRFDVALYAEA